MKILPVTSHTPGADLQLQKSRFLLEVTSAVSHVEGSSIEQESLTRTLTEAFRTPPNWSPREYPFTAIQPEGAGRRRALDFFYVPDRIGVELELGNQTVLSHDFLKLQTAFHEGRIALGVVMTWTLETRKAFSGAKARNCYLTYETAVQHFEIHRSGFNFPLALVALAP